MEKTFNDYLLFYVVDSNISNEELFTSKDESFEYARQLKIDGEIPRIRICEVKNAYWDNQIEEWNYNDCSDTFKCISVLK